MTTFIERESGPLGPRLMGFEIDASTIALAKGLTVSDSKMHCRK